MQLELTSKQQAVYDFIQSYIEENHRPPSLREIGTHLDLSVGTIQDQVEAIRRKGFLSKEPTLARSLKLAMNAFQIPILGHVHAGPLHEAIENVEGHLPSGTDLAPSKHFALKIKGDSMIDAGILEGDMVIVRAQTTAENGDVVVARVEDEATVKTLRRREGRTYLEPANPAYQRIEGPFDLVGVVVEVRRQYRR
jgi:repressor LexA